jgi:poly(hydroxyalkanoate) granule-associated protein
MNTKQMKESAKNAVLAGLGVVSIAQKEATKAYDKATKEATKTYDKASKEANKFYNTLLKEGKSLEKKSKKSVDQLTNKAEGKLNNFKSIATKQFNKLESVFETKVERALHKLDIPTTDDVKGLSKRVDTLIKEIKKIDTKKAA